MFGIWRKKLEYKCHCCGEVFRGSPSMAYIRPPYYFDVPEAEREARITVDSDLCHIRADPSLEDSADIYAIRCTLDVPIIGVKEPYCWGVWVTQSAQSFQRYKDTYGKDQSGDQSFGWLSVVMPYYNRTAPNEPLENLGCDVNWGKKAKRPKIILQACDHPLYRDQSQGISWDKAVEIAQFQLKIVHSEPSGGV